MNTQLNNTSSKPFDQQALEKLKTEGRLKFVFMRPKNTILERNTEIFAFKFNQEVQDWEEGMKNDFVISKYNYEDDKAFLDKVASGEYGYNYEMPMVIYRKR